MEIAPSVMTLYRTINLSKAIYRITQRSKEAGKPAILTFDNLLGDVTWFDNGNPVYNTFTTRILTFQRFYQAQQTIPKPSQAGPAAPTLEVDYHNKWILPALEFDADTNFIIKSVLVDADGAGNRTMRFDRHIQRKCHL